MTQLITLSSNQLHDLIWKKLTAAGLPKEQAVETANHLLYADESGIHSHGVMRVEYYAERIMKKGVTLFPKIHIERTSPSTAIIHGDNGFGHFVVNQAIPDIIAIGKNAGIAMVGISKTSHVGTMGYYLEKIAKAGLIGIAMCQSDPMVIPFGGTKNYFGTNPIGFGLPYNDDTVVFDMATTVQAWGKILDARSKNISIPDNWAVDNDGNPTTDPYKVSGLLPIAGPKGYGLMMLVDVLSGVLLGLPFGKHVSSMYTDLSQGRNLGMAFIVIDPNKFVGLERFKQSISTMLNELHAIKPNSKTDKVLYPGELSVIKRKQSQKNGILIPKEIVDYLESETIHFDRYDHKTNFAK
ncbi:ureidoglycolate dehydrogenase [Avibacterium sp. 21-599]|uniref:ureidoglycolate dehydrogenase n=1 Tax=Avibacterium sp. 21-599 TaxID=2911528 RepID=UPI0022473FF7|nr:ureidoglycolate dehydrogenase [Avibacterium sp. 21-599]MCW9718120.1 ureidoglycolate dehydrogenase [Avibacterium sp. 21-599]